MQGRNARTVPKIFGVAFNGFYFNLPDFRMQSEPADIVMQLRLKPIGNVTRPHIKSALFTYFSPFFVIEAIFTLVNSNANKLTALVSSIRVVNLNPKLTRVSKCIWSIDFITEIASNKYINGIELALSKCGLRIIRYVKEAT